MIWAVRKTIAVGADLLGACVQPMSALLDSLSELECYLLKTDMQQMDFTAVKSAGHLLKRCHYVVSEVFCSGLTYCEFPFQFFLMYLKLT